MVEGGSCRVLLDDAPDAIGIVRVFEARRAEVVLVDVGIVSDAGRAGGGMSAESLFEAVSFERDADERWMLFGLGNAGGISSSSSSVACSSSLSLAAIASCVSSGVEIETCTVDVGDETSGDAALVLSSSIY